MQLIPGGKKTATIDISRDTEFVGDDADRYSDLVDLGGIFSDVLVFIPALSASAAVSLAIQLDGSKDTIPSPLHIMDSNATGSFLHAISAMTTAFKVVVFHVGAVQYLRIYCDADQAADRTFYLRGC